MIGYAGIALCVAPSGGAVLADDEQDELVALCVWRNRDVDDLDVEGDLELLARLRDEADASDWVSV
jgi:hypothetical protein